MNKPFLDEDFKVAYAEVNKALTSMDFSTHDPVIEKIISRIDKELYDLEKYIDANYNRDALTYDKYPESRKRNKTMKTITLDNACMINKKIYERGTIFCIKEKSNSKSDIILDRSYRVNDIILQEGEVISLLKNKIKEGIDSIPDLIKHFNRHLLSDIIGSVWDAVFDEEIMDYKYQQASKINEFRKKIIGLYYLAQEMEEETSIGF